MAGKHWAGGGGFTHCGMAHAVRHGYGMDERTMRVVSEVIKTSFGSLAEVISAAKTSERGPKEPDKFVAPPLPSPGDIRGYLLAVRQRVIAGLPHQAEEVAAWWDEIGELMRRKKQGGRFRSDEEEGRA